MGRRYRKTFPCGHRGYGQRCHRCEGDRDLERQKAAEREQKQLQKEQWRQSFASDAIDLTNLMPDLVLKAREILEGLREGRNYREFGGKRLNYDRRVISIPINRDYRMICHDIDGRPTPQRVMSHETYNRTKPGS